MMAQGSLMSGFIQWQEALTPENVTLLSAHNVPGTEHTSEHTWLSGCPQEAHSLGEETDMKQNHTYT